MSNSPTLSAAEVASTRLSDKLSPAQVDVLAGFLTERSFNDGDEILGGDEVTDELYVLLSGRAAVRGTFNQEVNVLEPGSLIGELSFLDGKPRSASVRCEGQCRCAVLSHDALQ